MNIIYKAFNLVFLYLLLIIPFTAYADSFCDGYERGYIAGYMQAKGTSLPPLAPLCPLQPLKGLSDPDSDFEHGYTIGYREGLMKGSN